MRSSILRLTWHGQLVEFSYCIEPPRFAAVTRTTPLQWRASRRRGVLFLRGFSVLKRGQNEPTGPVTSSTPGDIGPLFSSSLDKQQSNADHVKVTKKGPVRIEFTDVEIDHSYHPGDYYIPPLSIAEEIFRHSGWRETRRRVGEALHSSGAGRTRLERFEKCGSDCIWEYNAELEKYRLRANYCGDRFCTPCCNARGAKIEHELLTLAVGAGLKWTTWTRRDDGKPLIESLNHLRESWSRLREQKLWKENVSAAVYVVEITRGDSGSGWHVHIHAILQSKFVEQRDWSKAWGLATGGSPVMHIRRVTESKKDVAYMCKYATKALHPSILRDKESTVEAIIALRGRRLIGALGKWHGLTEVGIIGPKEGWVKVGSHDRIVADALRGMEWAIGALRSQNRDPELFREHAQEIIRGAPA